MDSKKFLDASEVAAEFGLDEAALKRLVDSGEVRALADRGTWKYRRDELMALVNAGKIQLPSMDFPVALSEGNQVLSVHNDDDLSYIELDEEALAEQATMISKSKPVADEPAVEQDWFVPSDAAEMSAAGERGASLEEVSDSDVRIAPKSDSDVQLAPGSDSDVSLADSGIAAGSDSDVQIAPDYSAHKPSDSGILLDFNLDAGATVSSSGSSLRLPQTGPEAEDQAPAASADVDDSAWDDVSGAAAGDSSVVGMGAGASSIDLGDDSTLQKTDSGVKVRAAESGILIDDSHVGMSTGGSSVLGGAPAEVPDDSGITLDSEDDSGISLSTGDSGISLSTGDSGISLASGDSGISLGGDEDSGITLQPDSGLMMASSGDSGLAIPDDARTVADMNLRDNDKTQALNVADDLDESSSFDINLDDSDATSELVLGDDDLDEVSPTVIRKGKPGKSGKGVLSEAFDLDDEAEVEDLEISGDLDSDMEVDELAEVEEDEEVFDASDETFGSGEVETAEEEEEDYLEPAAAAKKPVGPREPAWGAGMAVGLIACSLFLAANTLILWGGVSTMWNGADAEGPAGTLIQTFGELIK